MTNTGRSGSAAPLVASAWLRALELTAPIPGRPHRVFPTVIDELAGRYEDAPALLSDASSLTYRMLAAQSNQYARWALNHGVGKGDTVALLMPNRPEYMAIWLGIVRTGGIVSLLSTNLVGPSLAHCVDIVQPKHIIVAAELLETLIIALGDARNGARIWVHGGDWDHFARIDVDIGRRSGEPLSAAERGPLHIDDQALHIYTSGTTGLPKAARVGHFRLMQWTHWFAGLMGIDSKDRMYNCLPMYHSVGGVVATGAVLVGGGSVVIRDRFAARRFWSDVARWDCTLFQYIGELCRYLLHTPPDPHETTHRLRLCCGNGLKSDVWNAFQTRFRIPRILEFYAATEGNFSLFNVEGKPGAIGRIPAFLAHRFPAALVKVDLENEQPVRDAQGRCIRCGPDETGEAIGRIAGGRSNANSRFDGYTSSEASDRKILRDALEPGDAWFRTGDLMRVDTEGYFHFVDRLGDTFRWKGENVSTTEVSEAICTFPGIREAVVYGVEIPGTDGRAGMAAIVADGELDLPALRMHLAARLPAYARPLFLRLRHRLDVTTTFRPRKPDLVREGYDPGATSDTMFFNDPEREAFATLDRALYERIQAGEVRA